MVVKTKSEILQELKIYVIHKIGFFYFFLFLPWNV